MRIPRNPKQYELTNHLGNVLSTVLDRKTPITATGGSGGSTTITHYEGDVVFATDYYPFGSPMSWSTPDSSGGRMYSGVGYRFGFNGKEEDNEVMGEGNFQDYGFRMCNTRLGRFISVDPLTKSYPELTPYQFASNMPIAAIDLDGLEAKLAIACAGGASTHYSSSDINAFAARATKLQKSGFTKVSVHNGLMMVDAFKSATKKDGSILSVVSFAHSGAVGIFLDNNEGYYTAGNTNSGANYSNVDAMASAVRSGEVKFDKGACWVFGSCFTANGADSRLGSPSEALAEYSALALNITTVGATGSVYPEIINGKETGNLKTDGTFEKFEPYQVSKKVTTKHWKTFLGFKVPGTEWTTTKTVTETKVKVTDLGNKIDPNAQTK